MVYSREQVVEGFRLRGVSISDWSRRHGFSASLVYAVLDGRVRGLRGEAHRIAQALRLVPMDEGDEFDWIEGGSTAEDSASHRVNTQNDGGGVMR